MSVGLKQISDIRMLDGFNEGWIEFANGEAGAQKGGTSLESVLKSLIQ
jgi:NAD(P)H dehydrogenase (quinone)